MPEKDFIIWLDETTYIKVDFATVRGHVVSFVVRLMWIDKETEVNVARYDTAHGTPHRDVMGRRVGLIGKTWYLESDCRKVLNQAINDFKLNYEDYLRIYERY